MQITKILLSLIVCLAFISEIQAIQTHSHIRNRNRNMNYLADGPAAGAAPASGAAAPDPTVKKDEDDVENKLQ
tara:strand:- start:147 stop:365 length:219 start_codon:yes stop_codon:yes gene_type:complete